MTRATKLLVVLALLGGAQWSQRSGRADDKPKPEVVTIPATSIFMTSEQKDQNRAWGDTRKKCGRHYDELEITNYGLGASNAYLVRGDSLRDAIIGTWNVQVAGYYADDIIVPEAERKYKNCWLTVFLGCSSSDSLLWLAKSVEVNGTTIKFDYQKRNPTTRGFDAHRYFYWVDVGQLKPGAYTVELYDVDRKEAILTRRVHIPK